MTARTLRPTASMLQGLALPALPRAASLFTPQWWWLLVLLAPAYVALAAAMPPADDELYYWCWSKSLQFSYYDHPGMSAYMIRLATELFGDSVFAIRLPAALASLIAFGAIGYLTRPRTLMPLLAVTPLFTFGAVLVTPDTPLLLFWAVYLVWLVKVHERLDAGSAITPGLWCLGGVILGCGLLGKYTMALGMMAGFASFLAAGRPRRWFAGYVMHGVVAFLVTSPILIHNIRHDFVPILYQWKHSMTTARPGLAPFAEFVGVQFLLFGTVPFWMLGWCVKNRRRLLADPRLRVCFCLFVLPFAFFLFKATRGPLEGNWALASYLALWPLAAVWYETVRASRLWRRLTVAAILAPVVCVLLVGIHLVQPLPILKPERDRIHRQSAKLEFAQMLRQQIQDDGNGNLPVFAVDYQWVSVLRYVGVNAYQIDGLTRPSHFTKNDEGPPPKFSDFDRVLVISDRFIPEPLTGGLVHVKPYRSFRMMVRGEYFTTVHLMTYSRPELTDAGRGQ